MSTKKMVVWKYTLEEPKMVIHLHPNAEVLCSQVQNEKCVIWVMSNANDGRTVPRTFARYPTGVALPDSVRAYVGTCQLAGGSSVLHVFEELG